MPEIRFAPGDDADIAYTISGDGDIPLVYTMGFVSHLEVNWSFPPLRRFFESLGEFTKLIVYDKRGMGMSSRASRGTPLEVRMDDIRAVLDHAGIDRAAMLGESEGGPLAMLFAAAHPERTSHLVLQGSWVRQRTDAEWAWGAGDDAAFEEHLERVPERWAQLPELWAYGLFGRDIGDPTWLNRHLLRLCINACAPRDVVDWMRVSREIDMREIAPAVRTPTLVLHCAGDELVDVENGRWLAEHIPEARYVERSGSGHTVWLRPESVIPDIREFLTGERIESVTERVLATVLFTDLVESTDRAARMGDGA
ncbi:MAG: alpha/beta hydrolase, partial [Halobacteriales archaeon]|nr:alpha/beta hydrolase [Halobacteriales archaeon]